MRSPDQPLPGDLVIRARTDADGPRVIDLYVITQWPDAEKVIGGPYQSLWYSLRQAERIAKDLSIRIWHDHAKPGLPEQLEQIERA